MPGAPGQATVSLSGTDFVSCFALPAGGSGESPEILTLDRVAGDGTASLSVYDFDGNMVCQDATAAAYQQIGCTLGGARHMAVVRSATGSGQFRVSQVTGISANCAAPASTAFGGPATVSTIGVAGDVRCYRVPMSSWIGVPEGADQPTIKYFDPQGGLRTCAALPCVALSTEVVVTSAKPATYQLDTWAVGSDLAAPADCGVITDSTAYGFGPVTATMSAADRAHCVSVQVGISDKFRLTVQNAVPYVVNGDTTIVRCAEDGDAWICSPTPRVGDRALVAFIATEFGPIRAEAACVNPTCGGVYFGLGTSAEPYPYVLAAGKTATFTIGGVALHQQDTLWLGEGGTKVAPIVVRSVSPNRDFYTVDVDLSGVAPGGYDITAASYASPNRPLTYQYMVKVQESQLAVTTKPSVAGKIAVGVKVTANPGCGARRSTTTGTSGRPTVRRSRERPGPRTPSRLLCAASA
ncbi:hypothetical protein [Paractinoplanes durhamensis]|uniref:hypothetical protein n=1 Tax=Paractinoplanes durhamensis TaxID=113563 RepID=UPI003626BA62